MQKLIDDFENRIQDSTQGIVINEYSEKFLKATFWQKKMQKSYRFNPEKRDFDIIEEEIVSIADFGVEIEDKKLLVFGNKQMAQRIITLISVVSENAYLITECIINIEKFVQKICEKSDVKLVKMKLVDITIEKGVMVNCSVNLMAQDNPITLVLKYARNIVVIAFRLGEIAANITVYKSLDAARRLLLFSPVIPHCMHKGKQVENNKSDLTHIRDARDMDDNGHSSSPFPGGKSKEVI